MERIFRELWNTRALVEALVRRHVATRYRGSLLGFFWSFMNPLCLMAVYTLVFHYYMRFNGGEHYHLLVFAGLLPWIWTSSALAEGTSSLVSSGHLITKSLFPAHVLPFVSVVASLVHFVLALPILALFMWLAGVSVTGAWLALPLILIVHVVFLHGLVLGLSALNVFYRDVQHLVSNILTFLFFLCPVVYPPSAVPERFRFILELNPLAQLTEFYQLALIHGALPPQSSFLYVCATAILTLVIGCLIHERYREHFAESL
jgi:ABC-type polysaccharide/polyol phosphate export permease